MKNEASDAKPREVGAEFQSSEPQTTKLAARKKEKSHPVDLSTQPVTTVKQKDRAKTFTAKAIVSGHKGVFSAAELPVSLKEAASKVKRDLISLPICGCEEVN